MGQSSTKPSQPTHSSRALEDSLCIKGQFGCEFTKSQTLGGKHNFRFYLNLENSTFQKYIQSVTFIIYPTSTPTMITKTSAPYEINFSSVIPLFLHIRIHTVDGETHCDFHSMKCSTVSGNGKIFVSKTRKKEDLKAKHLRMVDAIKTLEKLEVYETIEWKKKKTNSNIKTTKTKFPRRNLIICCDGTLMDPTKMTNVSRLAMGIRSCGRINNNNEDEENISQIVYYDAGIGTNQTSDTQKILDGITGTGIFQAVLNAYRFLVQNYCGPNDHLYFYGLSRGAYTVRLLIGLINWIGLCEKQYTFYIPKLFDIWMKYFEAHRDGTPRVSDKIISVMKKIYLITRKVRVDFVGVYDTVAALSFGNSSLEKIFSKNFYEGNDPEMILTTDEFQKYFVFNVFPDVSKNNRFPKNSGIIIKGYQAMALNEPRKAFAIIKWKVKNKNKESKYNKNKGSNNNLNKINNNIFEQVWFLGVHSDIGGGYGHDNLSDIVLEWMTRKSIENGVIFRRAHVLYYKMRNTDFMNSLTEKDNDNNNDGEQNKVMIHFKSAKKKLIKVRSLGFYYEEEEKNVDKHLSKKEQKEEESKKGGLFSDSFVWNDERIHSSVVKILNSKKFIGVYFHPKDNVLTQELDILGSKFKVKELLQFVDDPNLNEDVSNLNETKIKKWNVAFHLVYLNVDIKKLL